MSRWFLRRNIRARLTVLALALALPFVLYFVVSSQREADVERDNVSGQMLSVSRVTSARLDDLIGDVRQLLVVLAIMVDPSEGSAAFNDALLQRLVRQLPSQVKNLSIWNAAGVNTGTIDARLRENTTPVVERQFFKDALQGSPLSVEAPVQSISTPEKIAVIAVPIVRGGRVAGVAAASIRLSALQDLLARGIPEHVMVSITTERGVVVAKSIDPEHWLGPDFEPSGEHGLADAFQRGEGTREAASADGVDRIAGFSTAHNVRWLTYAGIRKDVALASIRQRLRDNMLMAGAMLLAGVVLAFFVGESIARPLRGLAVDATTLGTGGLGHRSWLRHGGELGILATTLNRMAEDLQARTRALEASQAQLRQITNHLPVLISHVDSERRFLFANERYRDWFGVDPQSLIGRPVREFRGEEAYATLSPFFDRVFAGTKQTVELFPHTVQGARRIEMTAVPDIDASGAVVGLFTLSRDVTEERAAEARVALSEERLTLALEASELALFDWNLAEDTMYHSAAAAQMRGEAPRAETARPSSFARYVHPDDRRRLGQQLRACVKGAIGHFEIEFRLVRSDGECVWVRNMGRVVQRDANGSALRLAGTYVDITERKRSEQALLDSEKRLRMITDNLPALVTYIDRDQRYRFVNAHVERVFGIGSDEMLGRTLRDVRGDEVYADISPHVEAVLSGKPVSFEGSGAARGQTHHYQSTYIPDVDAAGTVQGFYAMTFDITALKETQQKLGDMARMDALTGIPNRRQFEERLNDAVARSRRSQNKLGLLFLDIDHFKRVNDSQGHSAGDAVLQEFARRLQATVRQTDTVARLAGDEFVVLLEGVSEAVEVSTLAEKIVQAMRPAFDIPGEPVSVTTSIGVATYQGPSETPAQLLARADSALYFSKKMGRDRFFASV